jgi:hypothetical protein
LRFLYGWLVETNLISANNIQLYVLAAFGILSVSQ